MLKYSCFLFNLTVPDYYTEGAAEYVTTMFLIQDSKSGKMVWISAGAWDNRLASRYESVSYDPGTNIPMITTYYGQNNKYVRLIDQYSFLSVTGKFLSEKWFGLCISKDNLRNLVTDLNKKYLGYSISYEDYQVIIYGIQPEINMVNGKNGWFAATVRELWLLNR